MPVSEPLPRLKSFLRGAVDAEVAVAQVVLLEYVATCTHAPFLRDILRAFACATVKPRITRAWEAGARAALAFRGIGVIDLDCHRHLLSFSNPCYFPRDWLRITRRTTQNRGGILN
jgi:hypothetical protein